MFSSLLCPPIWWWSWTCSSSLTLDKAWASSALFSLNHDLTSVVDIDSFRRRLAVETATVQRVPCIRTINREPWIVNRNNSRCVTIVAEVQHKGAGTCALATGGETLLSVVPFVYFSSRVIKRHPSDAGSLEQCATRCADGHDTILYWRYHWLFLP